jgi:TolB protein
VTENEAFGGQPTWSPDGTRIAFKSNGNIYVMNADGSAQKRLTRAPSTGRGDEYPAWSPDGSRIAFARSRVGGLAEIYVIHIDGSGLKRLTHTSELSLSPAWSPDSTELAFDSGGGGQGDIYVMGSNGTGVRRLTQSGGASPAWSADGRKIAFTSSIQEAFQNEIYVTNADGSSGERQLTQDADVDSDVLSWR